jgi:hypothetical protein
MQPSLDSLLLDSAQASVSFALCCLEPYNNHLRAKSSFVDPRGEIMHWHDFGDLEGPGWAANAVGGALLLYRWGMYRADASLQASALALLDHVLDDGFLQPGGFIWPYFDLGRQRFCLNYTHNDAWLCPGSLAKIGAQMLEFASLLPADARAPRLRQAAAQLAAWLDAHTPRLENGWVPRRITLSGQAYSQCPTGGPDAIFDHSADGLFLIELFGEVETFRQRAVALGDAFVQSGGFWGSLNHDTYDDHENVAYSVAFRVLNRLGRQLHRGSWRDFACQAALPRLARFHMREDRNGVATSGLLWMEDSWDTAYLWENAEAAQAYLESWAETADPLHRSAALDILRAIAGHHHGNLGFLTEGVDWNNHVSKQHHVGGALYGDINYTEPLLNNLHLVGPTLYYLEKQQAMR